jgi:hypothetical protein
MIKLKENLIIISYFLLNFIELSQILIIFIMDFQLSVNFFSIVKKEQNYLCFIVSFYFKLFFFNKFS